MKSLPVWALSEVEGDLRAAIAHYSSWRSDGAEHVSQKYNETIGWIGWIPRRFRRSMELSAVRFLSNRITSYIF